MGDRNWNSPLSDSMLSCRLTKWSALISVGALKESEIKGSYKNTLLVRRMPHRKQRQSKLQLSFWHELALLERCLISLHFLWGILYTSTVNIAEHISEEMNMNGGYTDLHIPQEMLKCPYLVLKRQRGSRWKAQPSLLQLFSEHVEMPSLPPPSLRSPTEDYFTSAIPFSPTLPLSPFYNAYWISSRGSARISIACIHWYTSR